MSSRTADKFVIRLPDGLRLRIAVKASEHNRSMNGEIVNALEFFFGDRSYNNPITTAETFQPEWNPIVGQLVQIQIEGEPVYGTYVLEGLQVVSGANDQLEVQAELSDESGRHSFEPFEHLRPFVLKIGEGIAGPRRKV